MSTIMTAQPPSISMSLRLGVSMGRNQVQRNVGDYSAIYLADNMEVSDGYAELAVNQPYASNPNLQYKNLVLSTTGKIRIDIVKPDLTTLSFTVNRLLAYDDPVKSFIITNIDVAVARIAYNVISFIPGP